MEYWLDLQPNMGGNILDGVIRGDEDRFPPNFLRFQSKGQEGEVGFRETGFTEVFGFPLNPL